MQGAGWAFLVAAGAAAVYLELPAAVLVVALAAGAMLIVLGMAGYLGIRPAARRVVWPAGAVTVAGAT